jgi:hypothetical protein
MPPSSPPPDRFQREIDDIVRLAEKRLERQGVAGRVQRTTRRWRLSGPGVDVRFPSAETLAGWGLALLLLSWLLGMLSGFLRVPLFGLLIFAAEVVGVTLLLAGLLVSLTRGRTGVGWGGGGEKMWRGERISYGNPYGGGLLARLRRMFRGR